MHGLAIGCQSLFIDFHAAFGSVDREMMYKIMKHYGLTQKVVDVIRNSYEGFKCCVKADGEKGQMFDKKKLAFARAMYGRLFSLAL